MTGPLTVFMIGFVLEIVGLAVAAYGLQTTWAEHRTDERFLESVYDRLGVATRFIRTLVRRVLRRPPIVVTGAGNAMLAGVAMNGRARIGFGELPSVDDDPTAFTVAVDDRLRQLLEMVQSMDERLSDRISAESSRVNSIHDTLGQQIENVAMTTRHVAIGGMRPQVIGWFFVFAGFFLQALAQLVDGWNH